MSTYLTYKKQRHFQSLDGVRFFSILAVIWHHSYPPNFPEVFSRGFLGVDMFFVLSGYLIVTLLLREKEANQQRISLKNFYIRRVLRIFPVYFGVLIGLSFIYGVLKTNDPDSEQFFSLLPIYLSFLANFSLVHAANLGVYWSLATEEQFYVVWPLLEKLLQPKVVLSVLAVVIGFNQLINFGYLDLIFMWLFQQDHHVDLHILDTTFTPICLGVLLAHTLHSEKGFTLFFNFLGHRMSSLVLLIVLLIVIALSSNDISGIKRLLIQLAMFFWLASLVLREGHILKALMSYAPIKRLGKISYGMYVYHMFALHIVRELLYRYGIPLDYALFVFGLPLSILIAECSFRLYETPILSLSHRFRSRC